MQLLRRLIIFTLIAFIPLQANIPLFDAYPKLAQSIAHINLGSYPTPLFEAKKLSQALAIKSLFIKDDGACGYGLNNTTIPTGNKMRKLEFLLADAKAKGYSTICTVGSAGSNHALETTICAQMLGMNAVLVLDDQPPTSTVKRNLKLMVYFGAKIIYAPPCFDTNEKLESHAQQICTNNSYYFIPIGGSNEIGSLGYVNAVFELKKQIQTYGVQEPDVIYVTLGSTGTAAGIIIGAKAAGLKSKIVPVRISYTAEYKSLFAVNLINKVGIFLQALDPSFPFQQASLFGTQIVMPGLDLEINHDHVGDGYAVITQQASMAIDELYRTEGIKIEATYTGKTLATLIDDAHKGRLKNKVVLFWNTFSHGTFQDLTAQITNQKAYTALPQELHHYLTDTLQPFDQGI